MRLARSKNFVEKGYGGLRQLTHGASVNFLALLGALLADGIYQY